MNSVSHPQPSVPYMTPSLPAFAVENSPSHALYGVYLHVVDIETNTEIVQPYGLFAWPHEADEYARKVFANYHEGFTVTLTIQDAESPSGRLLWQYEGKYTVKAAA